MGFRMLDVSTIEGRRKLVASGLEAAAIRMNQFDNEPDQAGKEHDERSRRRRGRFPRMTIPAMSRPGVRPLASLRFQAIGVGRTRVQRNGDKNVPTS